MDSAPTTDDKKIEIKFFGDIAVEIVEFLTGFMEFNREENIKALPSELDKPDDEWIKVEYLKKDFVTHVAFTQELENLVDKMMNFLLTEESLIIEDDGKKEG